MRIVSRKDVNSAVLEIVRISKVPTTVVTKPMARCSTEEEATVYVRELDFFVTAMFLVDTPAILSLGTTSAKITGVITIGQVVKKKHISSKKWQEDQWQHKELRALRCPWSIDKFFFFIFTYFSYIFIAGYCDFHGTSSSTKKWKYEWRRKGETCRMDQQIPKTPNKNDNDEELQSDLLQDVPDGLQEFKGNLVDEKCSRTPRRFQFFSWIALLEPRAKVVSGKHSIYTLFLKDQNCDIYLRTKITRASCRTRTGTVVPRAEKFGDLMTADHKSSQWRMWISKQSSIRCCGARLGNTVVTNRPR